MEQRSREEYIEDRKYIHETLKSTAEYVRVLSGNFDQFKLDTSIAIARIQAKLGVYVAVGATVISIAVSVAMKLLDK